MGTLSAEGHQYLVEQMFTDNDSSHTGVLSAYQLQGIHADMRLGGISMPQVEAAIQYTCVGDDGCDQSELIDVLREMDRRYFLVQDFRWEFSMLDYNQSNTLSEDQAKWLVQSVHGACFSKQQWEKFLRGRVVPASGVSFAEIEVLLCDIPSWSNILDEEVEERRLHEEQKRKQMEMAHRVKEEREKRHKQRADEKKRKEEEDRKKQDSENQRRLEEELEKELREKEKSEEARRRKQLEEEEERGRREAEEREKKYQEEKAREESIKQQELLELQRLKELQEKNQQEEAERKQKEEKEAMKDEEILKQAIKDEKDSAEKIEEAKKKAQVAKDARSKKEHEDEEKRQRLRNKEARNKRIKYQLKVAVKTRDRGKLPEAAKEFKEAKLPDDDLDLEKAERILKEWTARDGLTNAMDKRHLKELESAINFVKRNNFEPQLAKEMIEANKILLQLRRLERIRAEILELKQSTVAEIRSYQKPPTIVHTVMIATFLLHGHKEKETKSDTDSDEDATGEVLEDWKNVQALVGKTGKDGLKRRCLQCEPHNLNPEAAARAKVLLGQFGLDDVRDVSAGAATFYLWSSTMIEELEAKQAAA